MIREKDYLAHYGVLGMKWGHRKDKYRKDKYQTDSSGRMTAKGAKKWYKDNRIEISNKHVDNQLEFDKTDAGKN